MNAHSWLTEYEHRLSMLLSQVFIYVTFSYAYQFTYQISAWISKISIFNSQNGQEGGTASLCQFLSKSLQPWPRYRDFSNFQDGGRRHVGFLKFQIFNGRKGQEGRSASVCQISSKSVEPGPRYVNFNIMLVWLKNAYSRPFLRFFGGTFPPNDVTHRPNIQRDHPFGRTTSFEDYLVQLPRYKRAIMSKIAKFSDPPHKLPRGSQSLFNRPLPNLVNI